MSKIGQLLDKMESHRITQIRRSKNECNNMDEFLADVKKLDDVKIDDGKIIKDGKEFATFRQGDDTDEVYFTRPGEEERSTKFVDLLGQLK